MIAVMTICYITGVLVAFKVIKIKVTPTTVATAVLVGFFMLFGIVILWKQAAPLTGQMFLTRHVLQMNPDVREFVTKVYVKENQLVKKGDPLFDIKPDRFQDAVDQSTAQLTAAKSTVSELGSAVTAAVAAVKKSAADTATSKAELDTALELQKSQSGAVAKLKVQEAQQAYIAAQANDGVVKAQLKQSKFSLAAGKHSINVAQAGLNIANFNREQCTYTSPVNGRVMNMQITAGLPVARWRFFSVGTIEDLSESTIAAVFPNNQLNNVKTGNVAEVAFKSRPGIIATGKVEAVVKYTGEGQFKATRYLPEAASIGSKGDLVVRIRLDDPKLAKELPLGAAGTTAIYTDFAKPVHVITKITVRIKAWMYYLPF